MIRMNERTKSDTMLKARILIVEDEGIVAKALERMLGKMGYDVPAIVSSGKQAILKAEETKPDLILMDIMLKGETDGIEAAEQIQKGHQIPVIYLTAYSDDSTMQRAKITEPYGYIIKPFRKRELQIAIEIALYKHKMEKKASHDNATQKQMQDELFRSEERYRILVENANEAILVAQDGMLKFVNTKAAKDTGYSKEELTSVPFTDFIHPDDREMIIERYKKRLNGEELPHVYTFRIIDKDGNTKWMEVNAALIDWEGRPATLNFLNDTTERRQMEAEMLKIQKLESIGVLAGGIAHDLNNLLTAVVGNISLAKIYQNDSESRDKKLVEAEKASMRIKELTQQLLTFSSGGAPIRELSTIEEILRNSTAFILSGSNVRCNLSINENLWPVSIDSDQMSQVVNNLVINADQAMPEGGIIGVRAKNIVVTAEDVIPLDNGEYVKISIVDHGIGIPENHLQKIFDPFFSTKHKGSGLGLATSFSIVQNHDGHITVESSPGEGTTFHIYLPASSEVVLTSNNQETEEFFSGKGKILIMDDEEMIRELAQDMLQNIGYEATTTVNGNETIKLYRKAKEENQPYDAVILDLTIPGGMGGKETVQALKDMNSDVKAIVSSGYSNDPIMADFKKYGFSGVIAKPYKTKELSEVLHKAIMGE